MLTLSEELFILSLIEKRNSITVSQNHALPYALAGAMLYELMQGRKIHLENDNRLLLVDATPTDQPYLNTILEKMQSMANPKKLSHWIGVTGSKRKKILKSLADSLLAKGVITENDKQYQWLIPPTENPVINLSLKFHCKERLRAIILAGEKPNEQSIVILSLLKTCFLLDHVFTADELKAASKKVEELTRNHEIGKAVIETISEISSAVTSVSMFSGYDE